MCKSIRTRIYFTFGSIKTHNECGQSRFIPITIKAYVSLQTDGFYTDVSRINFHIHAVNIKNGQS